MCKSMALRKKRVLKRYQAYMAQHFEISPRMISCVIELNKTKSQKYCTGYLPEKTDTRRHFLSSVIRLLIWHDNYIIRLTAYSRP